MYKVEFKAEIDALDPMMKWVRQQLSQTNFPQIEQRKVELAMEEALVNIIQYAYEVRAGMIELCYFSHPEGIEFTIRDQGIPFNPLLQIAHINTEGSLEEREEGGLGIFLMKEYMDEVLYERQEPYNVLHLIKRYQ